MDLTSLDDFFAAAVPTVTSFLQHVHHFSREEESALDGKWPQYSAMAGNYFKKLSAFKITFRLPRYIDEFFHEFAVAGLSTSRYRDSKKIAEIKLNIEGMLGSNQ